MASFPLTRVYHGKRIPAKLYKTAFTGWKPVPRSEKHRGQARKPVPRSESNQGANDASAVMPLRGSSVVVHRVDAAFGAEVEEHVFGQTLPGERSGRH